MICDCNSDGILIQPTEGSFDFTYTTKVIQKVNVSSHRVRLIPASHRDIRPVINVARKGQWLLKKRWRESIFNMQAA